MKDMHILFGNARARSRFQAHGAYWGCAVCDSILNFSALMAASLAKNEYQPRKKLLALSGPTGGLLYDKASRN